MIKKSKPASAPARRRGAASTGKRPERARGADAGPAPMAEGPEGRRIAEAVAFVRARAQAKAARPKVGIVLGSGLGSALDAMSIACAIPYAEIPGFLPSTVAGHAGRLLLGKLAGVDVVVMQGRIHLYEGHAARDVVLPTRVMVGLGADRLIITNAAGGANPSLLPGDLMLIRDHLNLTGTSPLLGPNEPLLGARFPDMTEAYDRSFRALAEAKALARGWALRDGVYAGLLGPSYETPAEIRMLHLMGADAVGMSTVLEVIAARHRRARVLGISCISNKGAGLSGQPLTHDEVEATAKSIQARLFTLVSDVLPELARAR